MAAAIALWKSGQPSVANAREEPAWTNALTFVALAFMSASLGVQGILGKRLNTQFGTTSAYLVSLFLGLWVLERSSPTYLHFGAYMQAVSDLELVSDKHRLIISLILLQSC